MSLDAMKLALEALDKQLLKQRKTLSTLRSAIESTPSTWVSLTAEDVWVIWDSVTATNKDRENMVLRFAEAIEAELREKNHA